MTSVPNHPKFDIRCYWERCCEEIGDQYKKEVFGDDKLYRVYEYMCWHSSPEAQILSKPRATMAKVCVCSERTIDRKIKKLIEWGFIKQIRKRRVECTAAYQVCMPDEQNRIMNAMLRNRRKHAEYSIEVNDEPVKCELAV